MTTDNIEVSLNRRSFLSKAGLIGVGFAGGAIIAGCSGTANTTQAATNNDSAIISTAIIAETLAVTTYQNIIAGSIYTSLASNTADQAYLTAAVQEEQIHLNTLVAASGTQPSVTTFYYPPNMFTDPQTTLNTLVTFEDAFIAAYLLGVQQFSTTSLRLLAARIAANESDHRVLARIIGNDLGLSAITGLSGTAESLTPSNNIAFERTFALTSISQAAAVLKPFFDQPTAASKGYTVTATYTAAQITNTSLNDINS